MSKKLDSSLLGQLIRKELSSIPIDNWKFFFPVYVAVWRFIQEIEPDVLGELSAGFDKEPYFLGKGSNWFCGVMCNSNDIISFVEKIMYYVVDSLEKDKLKANFVKIDDIPVLNDGDLLALEHAVRDELERSINMGLIEA